MTPAHIETVVAAALAEDAPWGDVTCEAFVPPSAYATAQLRARTDGTLAGADVASAAFRLVDSGTVVRWQSVDGMTFSRGDALARVQGPARGVLRAERIALNFLQRMSGIATLTAAFVDAVAGTGVRIVDTRKTTPGLRALEKHAVRAGGGHNHRFSLSDAVMVKDNHLAVARAAGIGVTEAILAAKQQLGHTTHVEVEVDRIEQIEPVLAAGVDTIMLDNFSLEDLRSAVALIAGRAIVEASGAIGLETVRAVAETGVDVISVGALTHSAPALDLGLDVVVE
ncbi:carboxylating nicotinate-nucleotide diphosphorylase [Ruania halotolerans]|uniref:carboxylating nicotinate-nucleotide diphosphorylase n=1 Tax=Ruania halotolerans TaxID=2897773 RepID=UPI001E296C4A|nr:carboxylating nicotinate-nucleotide diphosphorylase [Ruania halotolerans]UFU07414.1 carboxylating nicotinate-nucleotide diphosphorylase [Ruania halotolerans]